VKSGFLGVEKWLFFEQNGAVDMNFDCVFVIEGPDRHLAINSFALSE